MTEGAAQPPSRRRLAGLLIGGAAAGKVLGLVREVLMARMLGATMVVDSFRASLTAIFLPLAPLQGDVVPAVLIPLQRRWYDEGDGPRHAAALCALMTLLAILLAGLVGLATEAWVRLVVGGFSSEGIEITRRFVHVMLFAMPASTLFNSLSSVEVALGRSRITSVRSAVQNVGVISGVIVTYLTGNPIAIAWCFTIAFASCAVWGAWTLWREGKLDPSGIRPRLIVKVLIAFVVHVRHLVAQPLADQGLIWLERIFGSMAGVGTVAALDYARTLSESSILLISQPLGYVVLAGSETKSHEMAARVDQIARPVLAFALPLSAFLVMFAPDLVHLAFGRGAFTPHAELLTSRTLEGNSIALWANVLGWILVRLLNVAGRNARAAFIFVAAYACNAAILLAFMPFERDQPGLASFALGLAESSRGLILLFGTAFALGCAPAVAGLVVRILPGCLLYCVVATLVRSVIVLSFAKLVVGGMLFLVLAGTTLLVLMPEQAQGLLRKLMRGRLTKTNVV